MSVTVRITSVLATSVVFLAVASLASAQTTVAYWRFEQIDGVAATAGATLQSTIPGGAVGVTTTSDASGNNNVMRTFHSPNVPDDPDFNTRVDSSPEFVANVPAATVTATGQPNLLAGDFDSLPAQDQQPPGTPPNQAGADDIYSLDAVGTPGMVNGYTFNAFTVETSFRIDALDRFQIILGKDDNPDAAPGPLSPFAIKVLNNNVLECYAFDGTAAFRNVLSDQSNPGAAELKMVAGRWYNTAITNDGTTMRMYLDDTSDGVGNYVLLATNSDINGGLGGAALVPSTDIWTIGRGWFNGVADFFDGQIDEVRITDGVLEPSQFLFASAPVDANFDNDQDVDGADFLIWQRNLGTAGDNSKGDANGDGQITGADLTAWRQRFSLPVAAAAAGAVPEPGAAIMALVTAGALAGRRTRRESL
jgi:hypothetical protein